MHADKIAFTGVLTALITVSAFIRIPTPVMPFTLQVLIVLLAPMIAGLRCSFAAIFIYIVLGLVGFPVFATGGGPAYVLMPSFGFLIGFLLSTIPSAFIIGGKNSFLRNTAGGFAGFITIHAVGGIGFWLNMMYIQHKDISLAAAFAVSVLPFLLPDLIKLVIAAAISTKVKSVSTRQA